MHKKEKRKKNNKFSEAPQPIAFMVTIGNKRSTESHS